jgi:hypothetical protein
MKDHIIVFRDALKNEEFLLLLFENGKVVSISKDGQATLFFWNNSNFEFINNVNILGPFSKEEGFSNLN